MARAGENEKEALRQAAEAARGLLEKAEKERTKIEATIARLKAVIAAWEEVSGKRPKRAGEAPAGEETPKASVKRGQVAEHVDTILRSGGDYEEPELRKLIAQRFSVAYGRPSIYSALRRGARADKYEQKEGRWRVKPV